MKVSGFFRILFMSLFGLSLSVLGLIIVRAIQGLPLWHSGLVFAIAPFGLLVGWLWAIGALNPGLYREGATVEVKQDEEPSLATVFFDAVGRATVFALILFAVIFLFANLPGGFQVQTANDAEANVATFDSAITIEAPIVGTIETSQIMLFLAFVGWLLFSLIAFGGIIGLMMFKGHEQVRVASEIVPGPKQLTPPRPVRAVGRAAKHAAQGLRKNLPKFLGQR